MIKLRVSRWVGGDGPGSPRAAAGSESEDLWQGNQRAGDREKLQDTVLLVLKMKEGASS